MAHVERVAGHSYLSDRLGPESVIVDLGANEGEFSIAMIRRHGCRVLAVEPVPALCEAFPSHERLVLERVAITHRPSTVTLNLNPAQCASLHMAANGATRVIVDGVTLSDLLDRNAIEYVDLLKVDIEAAELPMFENTPDSTLLACDQISVEFHDFLDPPQAPAVDAAISRFGDLGFGCFRGSLTERDDMLFIHPRARLGATEMFWTNFRYFWLRGLRRRARSLLGR